MVVLLLLVHSFLDRKALCWHQIQTRIIPFDKQNLFRFAIQLPLLRSVLQLF